MKNKTTILWIFILVVLMGCKKNPPPPEPTPEPNTLKVTSAEFADDLLFVNADNYQIQTSEPAQFSSADPLIKLTAAGVITRITSGEVVPIDITSTADPAKKIRIYALGATDNNHNAPFSSYLGARATDPFNSYKAGWQTLRKLPVSNETYAIILRHADASIGVDYSVNHSDAGPADWWKSCDNTLARQLNDQGKQRSQELGTAFKDLQYPFARVITSEFCRSVSTAQLMDLGLPIVTDGRVNHPSYNKFRGGLFPGMLAIMQAQPVDNKMTLIVAHHPINETGDGYPTFPKVSPFNWTGTYIIKIAPDKTITYQGAVSWGMYKYWRDLKLKRI